MVRDLGAPASWDGSRRKLSNRRRQVSFQIAAPAFSPKPAGALAGHPFYRQARGNSDVGGWIRTLALRASS